MTTIKKRKLEMIKRLLIFAGLICIFTFGGCTNLPESHLTYCAKKCEEKQNLCYIAIYAADSPGIYFLGCEAYAVSCNSDCRGRGGSSRSSNRSSGSGSRSSSSSNSGSGSSGGSSGGGSGSGGSSHQIVFD